MLLAACCLLQARDLLCAAWAQGRRPGKAESAFLRAAAYLHAGNAQQALKDSRFALVYGPQLEAAPAASAAAALLPIAATPGEAGSSAAAAAAHTAAAAVQQQPAWPAALALQSAALEALADNVPAALAMAKALELDPECEEYGEALERLLRRIPEPCAAALQVRGGDGCVVVAAGLLHGACACKALACCMVTRAAQVQRQLLLKYMLAQCLGRFAGGRRSWA